MELAERRDPVELILARAMGADWLDHYRRFWMESFDRLDKRLSG